MPNPVVQYLRQVWRGARSSSIAQAQIAQANETARVGRIQEIASPPEPSMPLVAYDTYREGRLSQSNLEYLAGIQLNDQAAQVQQNLSRAAFDAQRIFLQSNSQQQQASSNEYHIGQGWADYGRQTMPLITDSWAQAASELSQQAASRVQEARGFWNELLIIDEASSSGYTFDSHGQIVKKDTQPPRKKRVSKLPDWF